MTTHEDRQLGQKVNEAYGRLDALGEGGMPQYVTVNKLNYEMPQN